MSRSRARRVQAADGSSTDFSLRAKTKRLLATAGLLFPDAATEAQYLQHRFHDSRVAMGLAFIMGVLYVLMPGANFSAAIFHSTPDNYYTVDESRSAWIRHPVGYFFFVVGILLLGAAVTLAIAWLREWPMTPQHHEAAAAYVAFFVCAPTASTRFATIPLFCADGDKMMRYDSTGTNGTCDSFIEPYFFTVTSLIFAVNPRAFVGIPLVLLMFFSHFVGRAAAGSRGFLLFEIILVFWTAALVAMLAYLERQGRAQFERIVAVKRSADEARRSRHEINAVLGALVPPSVLGRLVEGESVADGGFATALYADVAGFTRWCSTRAAAAVVASLNELYCLADGALRDDAFVGIVKCTTVGDCWRGLCGLPEPDAHHAAKLAKFAFWMSREVAARQQFTMRFGLHTGYIACGVVGIQQMTYEPYGCVTHIAELVESHCPSGAVQISAATHDALEEDPSVLFSASMSVAVVYDNAEVPTFVLHSIRHVPQAELKLGRLEANSGDVSNAAAAAVAAAPVAVAVGDVQRHGADDLLIIEQEPAVACRASNAGESVRSVSTKANDLEAGRKLLLGHSTPRHANSNGDDIENAGGDSSRRREAETVDALAKKWFRRKYDAPHPLLDYGDAAVEAEFRRFSSEAFTHACFATNAFLFTIFSVLYLITLTEGRSHSVGSHVVRVGGTLMPLVAMISQRRVPAMAHFASLYVAYALLLGGAYAMGTSIASNELIYVSVFFSFAAICRGIPTVSWVWVVAVDFLCLSVPTIVLNEIGLRLRLHHLFHPITLLVPWTVATRRIEIWTRRHFESSKLATLTFEQAHSEAADLSVVLQRCVPPFVVPTLMTWFAADRKGYIARDFDNVSVAFVRVPHLSQPAVVRDPVALLQLVTTLVAVVDMELARFPSVLKVKTVGDVSLLMAGVRHIGLSGVAAKGSASVSSTDDVSSLLNESIGSVSTIAGPAAATAAASPTTAFNAEGPRSLPATSMAANPLGTPHGAITRDEKDFLASVVSITQAALALDGALRRVCGNAPHSGIHCGPVTCGVIGTERPILDVFGDTCNCASRVASVTLDTMAHVDDNFDSGCGSDVAALPLWVSADVASAYARAVERLSADQVATLASVVFGPLRHLRAKGKAEGLAVHRAGVRLAADVAAPLRRDQSADVTVEQQQSVLVCDM